jgi:hypothetical protein
MSLRDASGAVRFWTARRALLAGSAAVIVAAGTTLALVSGHPAAQHQQATGPKTARLAASTCTGPAGLPILRRHRHV